MNLWVKLGGEIKQTDWQSIAENRKRWFARWNYEASSPPAAKVNVSYWMIHSGHSEDIYIPSDTTCLQHFAAAKEKEKYTHIRLTQQENPIPYYRSKLWWCGILLMGIGELGNFAAYGFAPATLIAPLGCVAVIGSAAISFVFLKESLRASDVIEPSPAESAL